MVRIFVSFIIAGWLIGCSGSRGTWHDLTMKRMIKIPAHEICRQPKFFFKSVINEPGEIGYVPMLDLQNVLNDARKFSKASKGCFTNWALLKTLKDPSPKELIDILSKRAEFGDDQLLRYVVALSFFLRGQLITSEYILESLIKAKKNKTYKSLIYNLLGVIKYKKREYALASKFFRTAISLEHNYEVASKLNMAYLSLQFGDGKKAYQMFRRANVGKPYYDLYYGWGLSCLMIQKWDEAKKYLKWAVSLDERRGLPKYYLGLLYSKQYKNYDQAIDYFETALNEDNTDLDARKRNKIQKYLDLLKQKYDS